MEVKLTDLGLRTAHRLLEAQQTKRFSRMYPPTIFSVCDDGQEWTIGNDLLLILGGFFGRGPIQARTLRYEDVLYAVWVALEADGWNTPELSACFEAIVGAGFLCVEGNPSLLRKAAEVISCCKALSNEERFQILLAWRDAPSMGLDVYEILVLLDLPDSRLESVRRHLTILEKEGFLESLLEDKRKEYRMRPQAIGFVIDGLRSLFPGLFL